MKRFIVILAILAMASLAHAEIVTVTDENGNDRTYNVSRNGDNTNITTESGNYYQIRRSGDNTYTTGPGDYYTIQRGGDGVILPPELR